MTFTNTFVEWVTYMRYDMIFIILVKFQLIRIRSKNLYFLFSLGSTIKRDHYMIHDHHINWMQIKRGTSRLARHHINDIDWGLKLLAIPYRTLLYMHVLLWCKTNVSMWYDVNNRRVSYNKILVNQIIQNV